MIDRRGEKKPLNAINTAKVCAEVLPSTFMSDFLFSMRAASEEDSPC